MIIEATGQVLVNLEAREWCKLPYPGHPKGCPNYGKKAICPPAVATIDRVFDLERPCWFVVEKFDLGAHAKRMKEKHPKWSDRQCRCVLYWQAGVKSRLKEKTKLILYNKLGTIATDCPEAMGVNVTTTLRRLGLPIKNKPDGTVYKVALVGYPAALLDGKSGEVPKPVRDGKLTQEQFDKLLAGENE